MTVWQVLNRGNFGIGVPIPPGMLRRRKATTSGITERYQVCADQRHQAQRPRTRENEQDNAEHDRGCPKRIITHSFSMIRRNWIAPKSEIPVTISMRQSSRASAVRSGQKKVTSPIMIPTTPRITIGHQRWLRSWAAIPAIPAITLMMPSTNAYAPNNVTKTFSVDQARGWPGHPIRSPAPPAAQTPTNYVKAFSNIAYSLLSKSSLSSSIVGVKYIW